MYNEGYEFEERKCNMLDTNLIKKERKAPKKVRRKGIKKVSVKVQKDVSFFDSFNHVAPLSWIPTYYQDQLRAAKPIRIYKKAKSRKKKTPLH